MSNEYKKAQLINSINQTVKVLGTAKSYSKEFQNKDLIAEYEAHLSKLSNMLAEFINI